MSWVNSSVFSCDLQVRTGQLAAGLISQHDANDGEVRAKPPAACEPAEKAELPEAFPGRPQTIAAFDTRKSSPAAHLEHP